ncbi:cell wall hydrolase [Desulfofalx alkaliphila]|uniref:cell wall hydrolase n=1 Tax=Desulfofalx alkaliphila TaxID=105483 RepID=UPI0004E0C9A5|nr:cell wall hydrolase [Desulfofalx alkaliphila]
MNIKIRLLAVTLATAMVLLLVLSGVAMAGEDTVPPEIQIALEEPSESGNLYVVQQGDTLYAISRNHNITVGTLMRHNGLKTTTIWPGQKLYLPHSDQAKVAEVLSRSNYNVTRDDIMLMARLIHAEARGESFMGKVAVGAVILNRIDSPLFPNTIRDVIMEKTSHVYQFSPVGDGSINLEPCEKSIEAALEALSGVDPTGGALFFYNPEATTDQWIRSLPVVTRIGNHLFASTRA